MVTSSVPLGGYNPTHILLPGRAATITLTGYDSDMFDNKLTSRIVSPPARGKLALKSDPTLSALPPGASVSVSSALLFIPDENGGGQPYANFTYETVDNYGVSSPSRVTVTVHVMCGVGRYLNQATGACAQCDAGTVQQDNATFITACNK